MAKIRKTIWVGFDLGGTKMLARAFDENLKPLSRVRKKTRGHEGATLGVKRMASTIQEALDKAGVKKNRLAGIGIAVPGPLDLNRGIVLETPNLGWKNVSLRARLERVFDCPVHVLNDVDAGVYGEYRFGAARRARCVLGIFPGTGIGGGCVYEGWILRGRKASCMEIGHMPVVPDGQLCGCGQRGCLETVAGRLSIASQASMAAYRGEAPHLLEVAGTDLRNIRSGVLAASIAAGDVVVERLVRRAAEWIGYAAAGAVNLLAPDMLLLGGGMVESMPELFVDEVSRAAQARVMPSFKNSFKTVAAKLGDEAAVTGAAAWAQDEVLES